METKLENTKELYQDKVNLLEEDSLGIIIHARIFI